MESSKRPRECDETENDDESDLKKQKKYQQWRMKANNLIEIIKSDIRKKFPLLAEEIFSFVQMNVINSDKEKEIVTYFICFYMIIRSKIGIYSLVIDNSLYYILDIFLKFVKEHTFILYSSDLYSFTSLLNIIKLDDFWDLNPLDKRIIYCFEFSDI